MKYTGRPNMSYVTGKIAETDNSRNEREHFSNPMPLKKSKLALKLSFEMFR